MRHVYSQKTIDNSFRRCYNTNCNGDIKMTNMNNVYIRKNIYTFWESVMPLWEFYTRVCSIEKRNPDEKAFFETLKSLEYDIRNLGENPSVIDFLRIGKRMEAMKRYKEIHNVSLIEAKKVVECIYENLWEGAGS